MKRIHEEYDMVVCGGGLAGVCAAIAGARKGLKTCLIHDRPVLGGNSSSEVGVTTHGAAQFHAYARETGILSEMLIAERAVNHEKINENGWTNSVWDMVQYDTVQREPNLTLRLNTSLFDVQLADGQQGSTLQKAESHLSLGFYHRPSLHAQPARLKAVLARTGQAEVDYLIKGRLFVDCTGDGMVADLAGCEWRMGSEGRAEFNEPHAPAEASTDTMGSSIHILCRDMGRPCPYRAPDWAMHYTDASFFYEQGRVPEDPRGGFWWLEIGVPWHTIHDNETIRHELTRHALGVWDWMKNRDPYMKEKTANFALDWIGQVPGKRESRRIIGRYFMTEHDIQNKTVFPDEIAYGGWFLDLHTPGGLLAPTSEPASAEGYNETSDYAAKSYCGPYGIPLRILISKDIDNLMMAGRNVSVTHAALGTVRVMATTALMGQAVGTAAAWAIQAGRPVGDAPDQIDTIQQTLLRDGCFLPNVVNKDVEDLALAATVNASSTAQLVGVGRNTPGIHGGLGRWLDTGKKADMERLHHLRAQWLAYGSDRLDAVEALLVNHSAMPQTVTARLWPVAHIWDYAVRPAASPLAETTLTVPADASPQWIRWNCAISGLTGCGYVRLDLEANPDVSWLTAREWIVPGHVAAFAMTDQKLRRFADGQTLCFRVEPPQPVYPAQAVTSGKTRPHEAPNAWRSDPMQPLPQWVMLTWDTPKQIACVEATFAGHLVREYHAYPPFYRDPQLAKDYRIAARVNGDWTILITIRDNIQRHVRHTWPQSVMTDAIRLTIDATHGDPAATVYELRAYGVT